MNYPLHNLELVVVVFALMVCKHYLYGSRVQIFTNHKSLRYLMTYKELDIQQSWLVKLIKDYDCVIDYHSRKENVVANALSCKNKVMADELDNYDDMELLELGKIYAWIETRHEDSLIA